MKKTNQHNKRYVLRIADFIMKKTKTKRLEGMR